MKTAYAIAFLVTACSSGKADSEQYVGLVKSPASGVPAIAVDHAAGDAGELFRALAVPHRQVGEWIGAHRFRGTSLVTVEDPVGKKVLETLGDTTTIAFDGQGFAATLDNSRDYGRHATFVDGELYLRPRFGAYHRRAPGDRDEPAKIRDEIYATIAGYAEPFRGAMKVADGGSESVAGRPAKKLVLSIGSGKPSSETRAHRKWRDKAQVVEFSGTVLLDQKTGVPLKASIKGTLTFEQNGKELVMKIEANHEFSDVGNVPKLVPPIDAEILATPERARETDDRSTLLRGIAPPPRRAPVPEGARLVTTLQRSREYLAQNRKMIIGRSLAAALAGALPVPIVEEWLSSAIQRSTIKRVAQTRGVDIDDDAARMIADGQERPPQWAEIISGKFLFRFLSRSWRRALVLALAARRMQSARDHYLIGTLFDHYCARLHVGLGIDSARGRKVRQTIDQAIRGTSGSLSNHLFKRALLASAKTSVRLPFDLLNWASGGAFRRLLKRQGEAQAVTAVDQALEQHLEQHSSFLGRATAALELSLAAETNTYLNQLLENFERLWREQHVPTSA